MGGWSTPRPGHLTPDTHCTGGWTCAENLAPTGIRSPDRPARSESLYRLTYPGPPCTCSLGFIPLKYNLCLTDKIVRSVVSMLATQRDDLLI
jgi:hypothetical protein